MGEGTAAGATTGTLISPGLGTVIGAGVGLLGDIVGGLIGSSGQRSANQTAIKLWREQRDYNYEMWNKQNAYNSPIAQIQRMREAGLNPALMYSQGNVGNAGEVHSVNPPSVQNEMQPLAAGFENAGDQISRSLFQYQQLKQMQAQTQLLQAQTTKTLNTTMTPEDYRTYLQNKFFGMTSQAHLNDSRAAFQDMYNVSAGSIIGNQVRHGELENQRINVGMMLDIANYMLKKYETEYRVRLTSAQTQLAYGNLALVAARTNLLEQLGPLQIAELTQKVFNLAKQGELLDWNVTAGHREQDRKDAQFQWQKLYQGLGLGAKYIDSFVPF